MAAAAHQIPPNVCDGGNTASFEHDKPRNTSAQSENIDLFQRRAVSLCKATQRWRTSVRSTGGSSCDSTSTASTILPFYEAGNCQHRSLSDSIRSIEREKVGSMPCFDMDDASFSSNGSTNLRRRRRAEIAIDEETGTSQIAPRVVTTKTKTPSTPTRQSCRVKCVFPKSSPSSVAATFNHEVAQLREELSQVRAENNRLEKENEQLVRDMQLIVKSSAELAEEHHRDMRVLRAQLSAEQRERNNIKDKYLKLKVQYFKSVDKKKAKTCQVENESRVEDYHTKGCLRDPKQPSLNKCHRKLLSSNNTTVNGKRKSCRPLLPLELPEVDKFGKEDQSVIVCLEKQYLTSTSREHLLDSSRKNISWHLEVDLCKEKIHTARTELCLNCSCPAA